MNATVRNLIAIVAAVVGGYLALGVAASIAYSLGPRTFTGATGELLLRFSMLWPYALSACVVGILAGAIVDAPHRRSWLAVVASIAAAQYILSHRYIAPVWKEWVYATVFLVLVAAMAAGAFYLVARRLRGATVQRTT